MSEEQDLENLFGSEEEQAPEVAEPSNPATQGNEPQQSTQPNGQFDLEEDLFGSEADDADILKAGAVDDLAEDERVALAEDAREDSDDEEEAPEEEKQVVGEPLHYRKLNRPRPRGTKLSFARLPPEIVCVEPHPFSRDWYQKELPAYGIAPEAVMRWRYAQNAAGEPVKQSNARFVRWSDGSMQLMVGSETYDVAEAPNENIQLFLTHERDLLLECHGMLGDRLVFRPASFDSASHKRLTAGLADSKYYREKKVKLINTTVNPETEKEARDRMTEQAIQAKLKLQQQQDKLNQKFTASTSRTRAKVTNKFLEEDEKPGPTKVGGDRKKRSASYEDSEESGEDFGDFIVPDEEDDVEPEEEAADDLGSFDDSSDAGRKKRQISSSSSGNSPKRQQVKRRQRALLDD